MSLSPGTTITKDPSANLVYTWDFTSWLVSPAQVTSKTITVSTISGDAAPLVSDNESVVSGGLLVRHRLTGGTVGKTYTVTCRPLTNETPAQTDDFSIRVTIRQQ